MAKYEVTLIAYQHIEVEAENEKEAKEKAVGEFCYEDFIINEINVMKF